MDALEKAQLKCAKLGFSLIVAVVFFGIAVEVLWLKLDTVETQAAYMHSTTFEHAKNISPNHCDGNAELHCDGILSEGAVSMPVRYMCDHNRCVFECK